MCCPTTRKRLLTADTVQSLWDPTHLVRQPKGAVPAMSDVMHLCACTFRTEQGLDFLRNLLNQMSGFPHFGSIFIGLRAAQVSYCLKLGNNPELVRRRASEHGFKPQTPSLTLGLHGSWYLASLVAGFIQPILAATNYWFPFFCALKILLQHWPRPFSVCIYNCFEHIWIKT